MTSILDDFHLDIRIGDLLVAIEPPPPTTTAVTCVTEATCSCAPSWDICPSGSHQRTACC